jgi:hypothetical protein
MSGRRGVVVPARKKRTTTQRGLGWDHQKRRDQLLKNHADGTPCPCQPGCGKNCPCQELPPGQGLPMFRNATRNLDHRPLEADHTRARSRPGSGLADRLLLSTCNRSRGAGELVQLITSREW